MNNKIFGIIFCAICFVCHAQSKWDKDLVVDYKMSDKEGSLLNHIVMKKDSVFYEWIERNKTNTKKVVTDADFENKILKVIADNNVTKFKNHDLTKGSVNAVFTYKNGGKTKTITFAQPVKQGSKEEKFIKAFMEPILLKMFEQELKNFPK